MIAITVAVVTVCWSYELCALHYTTIHYYTIPCNMMYVYNICVYVIIYIYICYFLS